MKIYVVGSINMDLVIQAPFMPENGMTITGSNFMQNPGGKGANQAVAAAKLGAKSVMVGAVGNAFGRDLKETLEKYNVDTTYVTRLEDTASGIAVIVIVDHDNRIILDAGANAKVSKEMVNKALSSANPGDYVICQLEIPQDIIEYTFKLAKERELITVLNPAPAAALKSFILPNTDYFIPNQSECEFYTGIYPKDEESCIEAAKKLQIEGVKNVVITLGTEGSCSYINDQFIKVNAHKVKAVDTTAAGDTYIGAFVTALSEGKEVKEAMEFASYASSITVMRPGAQQSIPTRNELE